ncbi:phosphatidylinositol 3,4,5-trisphosphate 3-phosphatase TPTE2-like isoform X2 [Mya arenaria]|uniref:phosphatidylinositol 3,4,5-trisphosphate 3-phosphatase TPTE2-like isoform X2 n=1 Tax=Mya arenaria TaxID=6604 RepID=UPI0022E0575F|nr:phosphatidylinositol 3,4,5-trisphosphate 3-phosphatase TPTE2-like isoform X2 [Mya arenaria]
MTLARDHNYMVWLQFQLRSIVEHIAFRIATVVLIILDLTLVIIDLADVDLTGNINSGLETVSHIIISYFVLEILMRIFYMEGRFFRSILDLVDGIIVIASFVVDMIFVFVANKLTSAEGSDYAKLINIGRVFRIIRIVRIVYFMYIQKRHVASTTRKLVSQNKRRYMKDGFDLDLCYITERIIAMSFPSTGLMAMYRNDITEVARFFDTMHKDHYRIYNLCSERDYDESLFHDRVGRVYIDDHNAPTVKDMVNFCKDAREFMSEDRKNVIALHCKGGKGRTGTMICVWLIDCGIFEDAKDSLDYFGDRRTDLSVGKTFQGVETPSQSRFVGYYEQVKKLYNCELPPKKELKITTFKIESIAGVGHGDGSDLSLELRVDNLLIFEAKVAGSINCECSHDRDNDSITITLKNAPALVDDVKVRFFSTAKFPKIYDHCAFFFWFHTTFIEKNKLRLTRDEIDNPHKPAGKKVFRETFAIEVDFEPVESF